MAKKEKKEKYQTIPNTKHLFSKCEDQLVKYLDKYIKKETALY